MYSDGDRALMGRALALARKGMYTTTPNPRVGCVIEKDGEIIGEGWHRQTGEPHAELLALASKEGRLQLALRNTLDTLKVSTVGARGDRLSASSAPASNRPQRTRSAAPTTPRADPTVVEGYRGGERTLTTFQKP